MAVDSTNADLPVKTLTPLNVIISPCDKNHMTLVKGLSFETNPTWNLLPLVCFYFQCFKQVLWVLFLGLLMLSLVTQKSSSQCECIRQHLSTSSIFTICFFFLLVNSVLVCVWLVLLELGQGRVRKQRVIVMLVDWIAMLATLFLLPRLSGVRYVKFYHVIIIFVSSS